MENVVRKYFDGVNKKDPKQIESCFDSKATIRDVCGISDTKRNVMPKDLADRCMEFLAAHPDCKVDFHYGYVSRLWWSLCMFVWCGVWRDSLHLQSSLLSLPIHHYCKYFSDY